MGLAVCQTACSPKKRRTDSALRGGGKDELTSETDEIAHGRHNRRTFTILIADVSIFEVQAFFGQRETGSEYAV